jgi:hypothetical protein
MRNGTQSPRPSSSRWGSFARCGWSGMRISSIGFRNETRTTGIAIISTGVMRSHPSDRGFRLLYTSQRMARVTPVRMEKRSHHFRGRLLQYTVFAITMNCARLISL